MKRIYNFLKRDEGSGTLWLVWLIFNVMLTLVWILIYTIMQDYIFPIAVSTGADATRPYLYIQMFFAFFPLLYTFGTAYYVIINSQKPEVGRAF